jgi:hypothetical protein
MVIAYQLSLTIPRSVNRSGKISIPDAKPTQGHEVRTPSGFGACRPF